MKKQCIIYRTDRIGDFICTIPALYACRMLLPEHHITLVTSASIASIANALPCIDTHLIYNPENIFPLSSADYCIVLNYIELESYEELAKHSILYKLGIWKNFPLWRKVLQKNYLINGTISTHIRRFFGGTTETQRMLNYISAINPKAYSKLGTILPKNPIPYTKAQKDYVEEFLTPFKGRTILCIAPCKEGASKTVPDSFYPHIINSIQKQFPSLSIVLAVSKGDVHRAEEMLTEVHDTTQCHIFVNDANLCTLVALIDACDIFMGSSSGPTHIAGLLNKKTIAFYPKDSGHTPSRWGIQGNNVHYILSAKNIDTLPLDAKNRFGEMHIRTILASINNFLIPPL